VLEANKCLQTCISIKIVYLLNKYDEREMREVHWREKILIFFCYLHNNLRINGYFNGRAFSCELFRPYVVIFLEIAKLFCNFYLDKVNNSQLNWILLFMVSLFVLFFFHFQPLSNSRLLKNIKNIWVVSKKEEISAIFLATDFCDRFFFYFLL